MPGGTTIFRKYFFYKKIFREAKLIRPEPAQPHFCPPSPSKKAENVTPVGAHNFRIFARGRNRKYPWPRSYLCPPFPFSFLHSDCSPLAAAAGIRRHPPLHIPPLVSEPPKKLSRRARFPPGPPAPPICSGSVQMCQESPLFFSPRAPAGGQQADASRPTCRTPEKNIPAWRIFRPSVQSPKFAALLLLFCCTPILFFPGRPTAGGQQANRPRIRRRAGLNRGANRPAFRRLFPNPAKTFGRTRIPPAPASAPVATGAGEEA